MFMQATGGQSSARAGTGTPHPTGPRNSDGGVAYVIYVNL